MKDNLTERKIPSRKDWIPLAIFLEYIFIGLIYFGLMWVISVAGASENFLEISRVTIFTILVIVKMQYDEIWLWHDTWRKVAKKIGLNEQTKSIASRYPIMEGKYQGYTVHIRGNQNSHGKRTTTDTSIEIELGGVIKEGIGITANNLNSKPRSDSRYQSLEIGDKKFDEELKIISTDLTFAKAVLSSLSLRERLRELKTSKTKIIIRGKSLRFNEAGHMVNGAYLRAALDILVELTKAVERHAHYVLESEAAPVPQKQVSDEFSKGFSDATTRDPVTKKIRSFLHEKLIPLGFEETSKGYQYGSILKYAKGDTLVKFEVSNRDASYSFSYKSGTNRDYLSTSLQGGTKEQVIRQISEKFETWLPILR